MAYSHILLATGGAEHSLRAEARAAEITKALGATLSIVTVLRLSGAVEGMMASLPMDAGAVSAQVYEDSEKQQRLILEEARQRCERFGVTKIRTFLETGTAGQAIVEVAEREGCDLIVTGRRKLSAIGAVALGSVSDYVNRHASCDVLIAR